MSNFEVSNPILSSPFEEPKELKQAAAQRWCSAVNALGGYGRWSYELTEKMDRVRSIIDAARVD